MSPAVRQRLYASLLAVGIGFLLLRTLAMIVGGALEFQVAWVAAMLVLEFFFDAATVGTSARWWLTRSEKHATLPLRLAAGAIIVHAVRVGVFTVGRVGPWLNFDIRPRYRPDHAAPSSTNEAYLVFALAVMGVLGVLVIWWHRRRARSRAT